MTDAPATTGTTAPDAPPPYLGLRANVQGDLDRWGELFGDLTPGRRLPPLAAVRLALLYAGLRAVLIHRVAHALHRRRIPIVPMLLMNWNIALHGFDVPPSVPVGPRFYVPHPVGTVIMANRIGAGVTLVSGVTIGMRKGRDFPTIGDGVYVGAGARILGGITIGDRAQIGANAVVLVDVPSDHVAVGVPATVRASRSS